jgi:hypothetical protein
MSEQFQAMTPNLKQLIDRLGAVRLQISAQKIFEEFVSRKPSESDLEVAALFYAAWCQEHVRRLQNRASSPLASC